MTVGGQGRTAVVLAGEPHAWTAAINAVAELTGVEALITDASTVLDDATHADPVGEGYLLLRTSTRGNTANIRVATDNVVEETGFTVTSAIGRGLGIPAVAPAQQGALEPRLTA